jgi:branched-chain amino acid transport system substrate-binding protein
MRWAFENLNLTSAPEAVGATGLLPEIKTSCDNHEGSGKVKIQQWDGAKWVVVSDWIEGNKSLIHPLFKATAAQYAKEKGITPRLHEVVGVVFPRSHSWGRGAKRSGMRT